MAKIIPSIASYRLDVEGHDDLYLTVEYRGKDRWGVFSASGSALARDNVLELEPFPSSRTEEYLSRTRYTLGDAMYRAELILNAEAKKREKAPSK